MKRLTFWLVWAMGAGPLLLAITLYFTGFAPADSSERGILLPAGTTLDTLALQQPNGKPFTPDQRWHLVLTHNDHCDDHCKRWQQQLDAVVQSLGKERDRVIWYEVVKRPSAEQLGSEKLTSLENALWLADPLGNLVLYYPVSHTPADVLKDLKRLLRVSRIG